MHGFDLAVLIIVIAGVAGGLVWFITWDHRTPNTEITGAGFGDDTQIPASDPVARALHVVQVRYAALSGDYDRLREACRSLEVDRDLWKTRAYDAGYTDD